VEDPRALGEDAFCSHATRAAGEPLAGSAVAETDLWFALEYDGLWPRKPLIGNALPELVTAQLSAWQENAPRSRFQFIRQKATRNGLSRFLVASTQPGAEWRVRFDLARPEQILELGLEQVREARGHADAVPEAGPVALVCCHGKRDRCCAKYGRAFYDELHEVAGDRAWQTTHLGGHRFAPTLVMLPEGISYGRLEAGEAAALWAAHERGEFFSLARVRGRVAYDASTQAAEVFIRQARGERALPPLGDPDTDPEGADSCTIRFTAADGVVLPAALTHAELEPRMKSCGDAPAPTLAWLPSVQRKA